MANEFDIRTATLNAFGYVGLPYPNLDFELSDLANLNQIGNAIRGKNVLGRPFFMDVVIDGVRLPNEPLLTITGKKVIVETTIVGNKRKGTVKEFITSGDYNIKIEGICIEAGKKEYPQEQVESIIALAERNEALDFSNEIAELFKINRLVIKDYGISPMQGQPYSQKYYLSCVSDQDFYGNLITNSN